MAQTTHDKKMEKRKETLSLPCRGRKLFMTDKNNETTMRTEIFKHGNLAEEVKIESD